MAEHTHGCTQNLNELEAEGQAQRQKPTTEGASILKKDRRQVLPMVDNVGVARSVVGNVGRPDTQPPEIAPDLTKHWRRKRPQMSRPALMTMGNSC